MSSGYAPMPPPQQPQPPERPPRPGTVSAAGTVMLVVCALELAGIIVAFNTEDALKRRILKQTPDASRDLVDTVVRIGLILAIVSVCCGVALAVFVLRGKNWARVVTLVLASLAMLGALAMFLRPQTSVDRAQAVIVGVAALVVTALLGAPASNDYFRKRPMYWQPYQPY